MPVGSPQRHFGRWLLAVTFVGLIVRVLFVLMVTGEQPIAQSDALYYSATESGLVSFRFQAEIGRAHV